MQYVDIFGLMIHAVRKGRSPASDPLLCTFIVEDYDSVLL